MVPPEFLGRRVWAGRLSDMPAFVRPMFVKLAEHKHTGIPAAIHTSSGQFAEAAAAVLGTGIESLSVVVSEPLAFRREFRTFITDGKVTAASFYLSTVPGASGAPVTLTWDAFTDAGTAPNTDEATRFAQRVVDAMGGNQPLGYTLDVGQLGDGSWAVVEANAAWSSNIYHADPAGAIESILAAQAPGHPDWEWRPDSFFAVKARALPHL
ncbi:ATP-grasp domain-containing protein [Arthrobacter sp. A2-55]|uniref:ATP-grasp domain-containing protein n=1 Tax=Arthrobacter sp. A2-55 TaxID=2897337 RepID=UPI00397783FF